jgi:hypothetical protein
VRTIPPSGIRPQFNCATYPTNQTLTIDQIMQRAQSWVDEHVPYSKSACPRGCPPRIRPPLISSSSNQGEQPCDSERHYCAPCSPPSVR